MIVIPAPHELMAQASWAIRCHDEDIVQLRSTYDYSKSTSPRMVMLDANMRHLLARKVLAAAADYLESRPDWDDHTYAIAELRDAVGNLR